MEEKLIQVLDKKLIVEKTEIIDNIMYIHCYKEKYKCKCKYCGTESKRIHSKYTRKIQDLSIQGYSVKLIITCNKYFCDNLECKHTTFSEKLDFVNKNAVRTKRVDSLITVVAATNSSINSKKQLEKTNIKVSKDTILRTLKKKLKNRN